MIFTISPITNSPCKQKLNKILFLNNCAALLYECTLRKTVSIKFLLYHVFWLWKSAKYIQCIGLLYMYECEMRQSSLLLLQQIFNGFKHFKYISTIIVKVKLFYCYFNFFNMILYTVRSVTQNWHTVICVVCLLRWSVYFRMIIKLWQKFEIFILMKTFFCSNFVYFVMDRHLFMEVYKIVGVWTSKPTILNSEVYSTLMRRNA